VAIDIVKKSVDRNFEKIPQKRGPHVDLSDAQLQNRRDQLLQLFEGDWARLGLALRRCAKPDDLIDVFSPLLNSYAKETLAVFCHPSDETATAVMVRKTRRELRALVEPSYEIDESKRRVNQQLREINWALSEGQKTSRQIVKHRRKKAGKEAWKTEQESRTLAREEKYLKERLKNREASFARQEIFRFVKSGRYELNPLSLANAVANIPYSGWRRSMNRIVKVPSKIGHGLAYQIFKAIRFLMASANKTSAKAMVTDIRARIPLLPSRHGLAKIELAKNWSFLERGIPQGHKKEKSPDERHFVITELYFKLVHGATSAERVVAEHKKIELSKRSSANHR
jgi:hypothetical protein